VNTYSANVTLNNSTISLSPSQSAFLVSDFAPLSRIRMAGDSCIVATNGLVSGPVADMSNGGCISISGNATFRHVLSTSYFGRNTISVANLSLLQPDAFEVDASKLAFVMMLMFRILLVYGLD
jgi:hypothetical protein